MKSKNIAAVALIVLAAQTFAGDLTTDAAIGGAIGGAVGGAVGAQVGGREGAIVGAGVGGAAGAAIATDGDKASSRRDDGRYYERDDRDGHRHDHPERFCPPGQAKKGRC